MRVIGVTGGVGAGKSTVLGILEEDFQAYVIQADQLGHILMEPGEECYDAVIALFGKEIIKKDKTIDRRRISDVVFTDKDMLLKLNGIIHPAVKQRILDLLGEQKEAGREICVVEAALFLEENYQDPAPDGKPRLFQGEISWHYPKPGIRPGFQRTYGLCNRKQWRSFGYPETDQRRDREK